MDELEPIEEYEKLADFWYTQASVKFEIVNAVKFREAILLAKNRMLTHRCLKINAVRFLEKNFERYHMFERDYLYNMYNSIARFPEMPMFSFNWDDKKLQQKEFNENFRKYIRTYDLVFDLDNPDMGLVYSSAYKLKSLMDKFKLRYWIKFSGTKGFHFTIDYYDFPDQLKKIDLDTLCELFKRLAYEMKVHMKIPDIDTAIYDLRRIIKTPYSIVYPYYYVALPLSDDQFENFRLKDVHITSLAKQSDNMRQRGFLTRNTTEPKENLFEFIKFVAEKSKKNAQLFRVLKSDKKYLWDYLEELNLV